MQPVNVMYEVTAGIPRLVQNHIEPELQHIH